MPSNSGRNTLSRQWELLKLLPTRGSGSTTRALREQLAEIGFLTTKRTVERDLKDLSAVFAIKKNDKSIPYGFSWIPPKSMQISGVTVLEALTLSLVQETLNPLIPSFMQGALQPHFELATSKLSALEGKSQIAKWPGKVASVPAYFPLIAPSIDPDTLACAQQALMNERQLTGRYCSMHRSHSSDLVFNPLGMIQQGPITYLIAKTQCHDDVRQYALHRMSDLKVSAESSKPIDGFDLKAYVASGAMQFGDNATGTITLEAWVNTGLLRMLKETPLSEDMETMTSDDGGWIRAKVADSWQLEWWLLSHTGSITVVAPDSLKQRLVERLRRGLELYADE